MCKGRRNKVKEKGNKKHHVWERRFSRRQCSKAVNYKQMPRVNSKPRHMVYYTVTVGQSKRKKNAASWKSLTGSKLAS
jgi:hypothetical protein